MDTGSKLEKVGVILVRGIGEQRRFEHLDGQSRFLIDALHGLRDQGIVKSASVDITPSDGAEFHAEQDSWTAGREASVEIVVHHDLDGPLRETRLLVHEVWWADINEPYSLAKQARFWLWGLAMWAHPGKQVSTKPTVDQVQPLPVGLLQCLCARVQLFLVAVFFVLVGYSIGTITFLLARLFQLNPPKLLIVLTNYVSAVKLYNQRERMGTSPFGREDFLDTIDEPPRVSIRRRMIRAIADVACNDYERWYVLAHSQGTVVAYNGLMETGYAWPGYLDEGRWTDLPRRFIAETDTNEVSRLKSEEQNKNNFTMPRRPGWVAPNQEIDRAGIFQKFRGLLTYGSPLAKFAFLWPSLVPMSKMPAFDPSAQWLNLYDPVDPVSGRLKAFAAQAKELNERQAGNPKRCCPPPVDLGYNAGWVLLLSHLKYLTRRKKRGDAATATVRWLLTGNTDSFYPDNKADPSDRPQPPPSWGWRAGNWFKTFIGRFARTLIAYIWWLVAAVALVWLGATVLPALAGAVSEAVEKVRAEIIQHGPPLADLENRLSGFAHWLLPSWLLIAIVDFFQSIYGACVSVAKWFNSLPENLSRRLGPTVDVKWAYTILLLLCAVALSFVVGVFARIPSLIQEFFKRRFKRDVVLPFGFRLDPDDDRLNPNSKAKTPPNDTNAKATERNGESKKSVPD
jgi:hypothetical protein